MKTVAFVPMRSGSKGIPDKNVTTICGEPLFDWALSALYYSEVDEVVVSTDSEDYAKQIKRRFSGIKIVNRSEEVSFDGASTESTVLEYLNTNDLEDFTHILLVQLTNPFLTDDDVNNILKMYEEEDYDSILSVVDISERFLWKENGVPLNYKVTNRKRRQELSEELYIENGSMYLTSIESFKKEECRLSGSIGYYFMNKKSFFEIDSREDLSIIGSLLKTKGDLYD